MLESMEGALGDLILVRKGLKVAAQVSLVQPSSLYGGLQFLPRESFESRTAAVLKSLQAGRLKLLL